MENLKDRVARYREIKPLEKTCCSSEGTKCHRRK